MRQATPPRLVPPDAPPVGALTRRSFLARAGAAGAALALGGVLDWAPAGATEGQPIPLLRPSRWQLGAELQYFRSDPAHLADRLALARQAGYTTIQAYVPWNVHEAQRGSVDFSGRTHPVIVNDHADQWQIETPDDQWRNGGLGQVIANTDLLGYLRTLASQGFRVILRPGPFISDEWRNGGLPDWLLDEGYPDIFMRGPDGTTISPGFPLSSPPAANVTGGAPLFYFAGPSYASEDYLLEARRWLRAFVAVVQPWLATRGGPVVAIQVDDETCFYYRFGPFECDYHPSMVTRYRSETGSSPPTSWPPEGAPPTSLRPALEWQRFKARQIGRFLGALADDLRTAGVDVPITHELELQLSPSAGMLESAAAVDLLDCETYNGGSDIWAVPLNELDAGSARAAQRQRRPVIAAEMDNGDMRLYTVLIGEGLAGGLQFTYTDGVPEGAFDGLRRLGRTVQAAGARLARTRRRVDTAIVWAPGLTHFPYDSERYGFDRDVRGVIERDVPQLATLLVRAGLAFDLLDVEAAADDDYLRYPTVWLASSDVLSHRAQAALVRYVEHGGRLIAWPAPPTLDELLRPDALLAQRLFPERPGTFHREDVQEISVAGLRVPVYRGVQTFTLSAQAQPIAFRGGAACGYLRRYGHGEAILLGSWPAADSIPGRAGVILDVEQVPQGGDARESARALVARRAGRAAAASLRLASPTALAGAGEAEYLILYYYSNERRGGEVITGGIVAYWDGDNVVPLGGFNAAAGGERGAPLIVPSIGGVGRGGVNRGLPLERPSIGGVGRGSGSPLPEGFEPDLPPFRPIVPAHLELARRLHRRSPAARVSDPRVEVRVLDAGESTTVTAANLYPEDARATIALEAGARAIRLPERGQLILPAREHVIMPIAYELGHGARIAQATAQLLDYASEPGEASLTLYTPAGGELIVELPGMLRAARIAGRVVTVGVTRPGTTGSRVRLTLPAGEQQVGLTWMAPRRSG